MSNANDSLIGAQPSNEEQNIAEPCNSAENNEKPSNEVQNDAQSNIEELNLIISKLKEEKDNLEKDNSDMKNKNQDLKNELIKIEQELNNEITKIENYRKDFEKEKEVYNDEISKLKKEKEEIDNYIRETIKCFEKTLQKCVDNEQEIKEIVRKVIKKFKIKDDDSQIEMKKQEISKADLSDDLNENKILLMDKEEKNKFLTNLIDNNDFSHPPRIMYYLLEDRKSIDDISTYLINYIHHHCEIDKNTNSYIILKHAEQINDETMFKLMQLQNFSLSFLSEKYLTKLLNRLFSYKNLLIDSKRVAMYFARRENKEELTKKEIQVLKNALEDIIKIIYDIEDSILGKVSIGQISFIHSGLLETYDLKNVIIESSIEEIKDKAFFQCNNLESVEFESNSVTKIGSYAFALCEKLKSFEVPPKVTIIPDHCFNKCTDLEALTLNENIIEIKEKALSHCKSIKKIIIPKSTTKIGKGIFKYCTSLNFLDIPGVIKCQDDSQFDKNINENEKDDFTIPVRFALGCTSIKNIKIMKLKSSLTIENNAFENNSNLQFLEFDISPSTIIGKSAFQHCKKMKNINFNAIPNSSLVIGELAFNLCKKLQKVNFNNFDDISLTIGNGAFMNCKELVEITIPNQIKEELGSSSFENCHKLESVTLPENITKISTSLFRNDSELKHVNYKEDTITSIESNAFENCYKLDIEIPPHITHIGDYAFSECKSMTLNKSLKNNDKDLYEMLPEELKELKNNLSAEESEKFTIYKLPDSLLEIGNFAFMNCESLAVDVLIIPKSVEKIGKKAFTNCPIKYVVIKSKKIVLGSGAFYKCPYLIRSYVPEIILEECKIKFKENGKHYKTDIDTSEECDDQNTEQKSTDQSDPNPPPA